MPEHKPAKERKAPYNQRIGEKFLTENKIHGKDQEEIEKIHGVSFLPGIKPPAGRLVFGNAPGSFLFLSAQNLIKPDNVINKAGRGAPNMRLQIILPRIINGALAVDVINPAAAGSVILKALRSADCTVPQLQTVNIFRFHSPLCAIPV